MNSTRIAILLVWMGGFSGILILGSSAIAAQQAAAPQPAAASQSGASRVVGAITAINGSSLTVKPDTGTPTTITIADTARLLQTVPGAKTIAGATPIHLTDLAVGDRVLVAIHTAADGSAPTATTVVAMRQADINQKQQADQEDWQRRGLGGIVKTVDTSTATLTISRQGRALTIHATPNTVVRIYDPGSIKFSDSKVSTLDQIHVGDQLRARGDRNADGTEIQADEIVAGSFRNIAGAVVSADPAANTVTVTDSATKKPVVMHVNSDSQLHKLPEMMAQAMAARFKPENNGEGRNAAAGGASHPHTAAAEPETAPGSPRNASGEGQRRGDLSQMLQRTPVIQLSDLQKGDVVMIVANQGSPGSLTVCTLLAGVEPILSASAAASQNLFAASWNLGGQAGGGGESQAGP